MISRAQDLHSAYKSGQLNYKAGAMVGSISVIATAPMIDKTKRFMR